MEEGKEIYNDAGIRIVYLEMSEGRQEEPGDFGAEIAVINYLMY